MKIASQAILICLVLPFAATAFAQIPPDEQVDEPQQVTGSFRLGGEIRGEELQAALIDAAAATMAESTPMELHDPAYEQYVNMSSVGAAWQKQDAAALTDGALQLLEGERILLRPHSKLPADKVMELAAKVASENHDSATLERLKKAAEVHGKKQLLSQLAAAGKLGAAARSDDGLSISVDEVSPEEFFAFRDYADRIRSARIAGEAVTLENLKDEISSSELLQPKLREHLLEQVTKTSAALPKGGAPDEAIAALTRLGGASRGWFSDATGFETPDPIRKIAPNGISIGGRQPNGSSISVMTPPSIDRHGNIRRGSSSGGDGGDIVGKAQLQYSSSGAAYWVSNYSNYNGRVQSPVRADARYDRKTGSSEGSGNVTSIPLSRYSVRVGGATYYQGRYMGQARETWLAKSQQKMWIYTLGDGRQIYRTQDGRTNGG
jgi:hypothetical protein